MSMMFRPDLFRIDGEFAQTYVEDALLAVADAHEDDPLGILSARNAINDIGICAATSKPTDLKAQDGIEVYAIGATNGARVKPLHGFVYRKQRGVMFEFGVWVVPESRGRNIGKQALVGCLAQQINGHDPQLDRRSQVLTPDIHNDGSRIVRRLPASMERHGWANDIYAPVPLGLLFSTLALELSDVHTQDMSPLFATLSHRYRINLPDRDI